MLRMFMKEPLWLKALIILSLIISIVFSSSLFSYNANYESLAKLAGAIFFFILGTKFRMNLKVSIIFFALVVICIYLSWKSFDYTSL
jgi:hypothetical protein